MSRHSEQTGNGRRVRTAHTPLSSFLQTPHRQGIENVSILLRPAAGFATQRTSISALEQGRFTVRGTMFNVIAAKIIRSRLRSREAARWQPAVRWAAASVAVSRLWREVGVEEATRPTTRSKTALPRWRRGSVAARCPRGAPGGGKYTATRAPMNSVSCCLT